MPRPHARGRGTRRTVVIVGPVHPPMPGGGALTIPASTLFTMELEGTGASDGTIYTFGMVFKEGDVGAATPLLFRRSDTNAEIRTQLDRKTAWSDGSLKHGLLAIELPSIGIGSFLSFHCVQGETHSSPGSNIVLATALSGRTAIAYVTPAGGGAEWPLDLAAGIGATRWRDGPLVSEARIRGDIPQNKAGAAGVSDSTGARIVADLWCTKDGGMFADVQWCNDSMTVSGLITANFAVRLNLDGTSVFTESAKSIPTSIAGVRIYGRKSGADASYWPAWSKGPAAYMATTKLFPLYDVALGVSSSLETDYSTNRAHVDYLRWMHPYASAGGYEANAYHVNGNTTGDNEGLYGIPVDNPQAAWLIGGGQHAQQYSMDRAQAAHGQPTRYWDPVVSRWINVTDRPSDRVGYTTPGGGSGLVAPDYAHTAQVNILPYLMRGRRSMLDILQATAAASCQNNYYYTSTGNPMYPGDQQVRALGYHANTTFWAEHLSPPSEQMPTDYFKTKNAYGLALFVSDFITPWQAAQGEPYGYIPKTGTLGTAYGDYDIVQFHYPIASMALCQFARVGDANAITLMDWMSNYGAGGLNQTGNGWPYAHFAYRLAPGQFTSLNSGTYVSSTIGFTTWATFRAGQNTYCWAVDEGTSSRPTFASTNPLLLDNSYARYHMANMVHLKVARPANSAVTTAHSWFVTNRTSVGVSNADLRGSPKNSIIIDAASTRV